MILFCESDCQITCPNERRASQREVRRFAKSLYPLLWATSIRLSSHVVFKMPWMGDPRINIQNFQGKAKPYQVRQALGAIQKLLIQNEH